jgi:aldose sugar dehydrogenase
MREYMNKYMHARIYLNRDGFYSNMLLSRLVSLAVIVIVLLQLVNIIHITNSSIYKTSPIFLNRVYAETPPQQLQLENVIGDACIPGSLPYIGLIMNITHQQQKASLGNPTSGITKILDDSHQENNTIDTGSYKIGTDATKQNRSNEADAKYYQNFTDGAIYWKRDTGAHEVHSSIYNKWKEIGLERSFLGFPLTDVTPTPEKDGAFNLFEGYGGAIYWSPLTGAHVIQGSIFEKWKSMGAERSFLGYPITDEMTLPEGKGAISYFQGGAIMWTQETGAFVIHSKDFTDYFQSNNTQELPVINETAAATKINKDIIFEPIFEGINFPTSMAFLDPDDILILEKSKGTVKRFVNGSLINEPLLDVNVAYRGERGMLGIAVARDFQGNGSSIISDNDDLSTNGTKRAGPITNFEQSSSNLTKTYVFLYFTESRTKDTGDVCEELLENEVIGNRLYRYELAPNGTKLINPKLLLSLPATFSAIHQGGKMLVGPDNNLYLIVGDTSRTATRAQNDKDGNNANGTSVIYRITIDGEPAQGNPFGDDPSLAKFYAYGIRNSFGLDIDPVTGRVWDTENGEDNFDEINMVEPGFNSGWTTIQGLVKNRGNFSFSELAETLSNKSTIRGVYSDPEFVWNLTVGVTDIEFFNSDKLGQQYKNDMFVASIVDENLYRFELNENRTELLLCGLVADKIANKPIEQEKSVIAHGFGSITDIETSPDGYLYLASIKEYYPEFNSSGTVYKVIPATISTSPSEINNDSHREELCN